MTTSTGVSRRQFVIGWVAVALSVMAASFLGVFAGGEGVSDGWQAGLSHLFPMLVLIVSALIAVRRPRLGGVLYLFAGAVLFSRIGFASGFRGILMALPIVLPVLLAGILYLFGRPGPRRLAYALIIGIPIFATALAAILIVLFPPQG